MKTVSRIDFGWNFLSKNILIIFMYSVSKCASLGVFWTWHYVLVKYGLQWHHLNYVTFHSLLGRPLQSLPAWVFICVFKYWSPLNDFMNFLVKFSFIVFHCWKYLYSIFAGLEPIELSAELEKPATTTMVGNIFDIWGKFFTKIYVILSLNTPFQEHLKHFIIK